MSDRGNGWLEKSTRVEMTRPPPGGGGPGDEGSRDRLVLAALSALPCVVTGSIADLSLSALGAIAHDATP